MIVVALLEKLFQETVDDLHVSLLERPQNEQRQILYVSFQDMEKLQPLLCLVKGTIGEHLCCNTFREKGTRYPRLAENS